MPETDGQAPEEDGAKKSFWEHVHELRTALLRSAIVVGVALIACLLLNSRLVNILEYPLRHINLFESPKPTIQLQLGSMKLGPFEVTRDQFAALPPGVAPHVVFQVGTMEVGGQQVVTLKLDPTVPAESLKVHLHNLGPAEAFAVAFKVAFYGALVIAAPFWMFFIGGFLLPALHRHERKVIFQWAGWGGFLFIVGVLSTYFVLLPIALRASIEYSDLLGFEAYDWRAEDYIGFVCKFLLGMGLGFQFPLVVLFLVKLGLVTHRQLAHYRRHVIVLSFVLGAVLTTPEVITQVAMAVPLYLLYEICIWIAWFWERKKRRAEGRPA